MKADSPVARLPVPKCEDGDVLGWFLRMAREFGDHPRRLAKCPNILAEAGIDVGILASDLLEKATEEAFPLACEWAESHNAAIKKGTLTGAGVAVSRKDWFQGGGARHNQTKKEGKVKARKENEKTGHTLFGGSEGEDGRNDSGPAPSPENANTAGGKGDEMEATVLGIPRNSAVSLLIECGYGNARTLKDEQLKDRLRGLPEMVRKDKDYRPQTADGLSLLKQLQEVIDSDGDIEIKNDEDGGPEPPKQKGGKVKTEAKKGKGDDPKPDNKSLKNKNPKAGGKDKANDMSALDAAAKVLSESKKPLKRKELVEAMAEKGYWTTPGGKTPSATVAKAIQVEIKEKGKKSRFKMAGRGLFALKK